MTLGQSSTCQPGELREALAHAHVPTLLVALATLGGDDGWLREQLRPAAPRGPEEGLDGGRAP